MFRRRPLALAVSAALATAVPFAGASETMLEEVVVQGSPIRDAQAAAIEAKRASDNVVDIISSDTIGRFPDQNLADSLGRLPGLAIERDQGQARFINFRGAPFRWTAIAFDGIDVLGAENGRIPRFDSFPSVITSSVAANKAVTPDMPGEAVAGFIDIRTFSPFDIEGPSFSLEGGLGEQELGGGDIDKLNGRASWSNDRFGVVLFGSHNSREQVTDNREFELAPVAGGVQVNNLDYRSYRLEREDNAYGGKIEFRPREDVRLFATSLFSEFIDREERNQFDFDFQDEDNPGFGVTGAPLEPTTGYQPTVLVTRLLEDGKYRNFTRTQTLGADFPLADAWRIEARLNYTETGNDTELPIPFSAGGAVAASYDLRDVESPVLEVFEPGTTTPMAIEDVQYAQTLGLVFAGELNSEAWKVKLDAERDLPFAGTESTLKVGFQYDGREAEGGDATAFGGFPQNVVITDFLERGRWDTDFDDTLAPFYIDNDALRNAWEAEAGDLSPTFDDDSLVAIDEDIWAAYLMLTTPFAWGNVVYGARVEHTDYTSAGPALDTEFEADYTDILPSVHVNVNLREDLKLRVSGTSGLSRPTYNELRASASVNPAERAVSGGNPLLDAETVWGGDVSLEWYFAPASLASIATFYRSVDNVLYSDSITVDGGVYFPPDQGVPYQLSGTVNGEDGELTGLEINFVGQATDLLPAPFDGFGISGNVTLLDSEFDTRAGQSFSLPGTSEVIYNGSLYYEKYGLSARLNYQYRDDWLSTTEEEGLSEFWAEQERVDASIRYILPIDALGQMQLTVFANANNLTDFVDVRYTGTPATPNQVEGFGRRYLVGLRMDF